MTSEQRIECTALNSQVYALKRIIYCVDEPFRQQGYHSYHTMVQLNINEERANRYSDYEWCKAKLTGILAALDYRVAWGVTVGTNAGVLIKDGVIIGLAHWSALRIKELPSNYANAAVTPPGTEKYLPVGLRNIEPVYADPNEPFKPFPKPDGRLPNEVAADITGEDSDSTSELFNLMALVVKAASVILSQSDQVRFFEELDRLQTNS